MLEFFKLLRHMSHLSKVIQGCIKRPEFTFYIIGGILLMMTGIGAIPGLIILFYGMMKASEAAH